MGDPPVPVGWHYTRQMELVSGSDAPSGKNYVLFTNSLTGRPSQALQGFAIDGRKIRQIEVSLWVRGRENRPADRAGVVISFYDENRADAGRAVLGPWSGTFAWRLETHRFAVPGGPARPSCGSGY